MYHKTVLDNRLRIVTHEMEDRESVSLGVWIAAGGRYENDQNKGVAHFLEHIAFKGTKKYSCDEIKKLIEGVGGTLNAFTSEEYTCYFAKMPAKHLEKTFDILADMVQQPLIDKKDVDKERTVILEEIKMYRDLPQHLVIEFLEELMWPNHPLGKNLAGTFESISAMTEADLRRFHRSYYLPGNIVIATAGRFKHGAVVSLARKKLGKLSEQSRSEYLEAQNSQNKPHAKFHRKDIEQMHLALGSFGLKNSHKDKHVFSLLNVILGANMSSRLFDEVREKRGLAYAIASSVKSLSDTGLFLIRAGVDNKKIVEATEVILKEISKIKSADVTQDEFTRAKDYYMGQILLGLEDTLEHMLWIGEPTVSLNKTYTLAGILKEIKQISVADIRRVANEIFKENHFNLSIVGPLEDTQEKDLSRLVGAA